jgi:glucosamine--fructose-6-phosphate aminotransferase (isomerizing)
LPVVILATHDKQDPESMLLYEKSLSSLHEFVQREIPVIAIASEGDQEIRNLTSGVVFVPEVPTLLQPIVEVIPLQLLAYHIAVLCGRNVDRPRHLSKSVVVE